MCCRKGAESDKTRHSIPRARLVAGSHFGQKEGTSNTFGSGLIFCTSKYVTPEYGSEPNPSPTSDTGVPATNSLL